MKITYSKLLLMGVLSIFIYSCSQDDSVVEVIEENVPNDYYENLVITPTFGIRHDKTLAEYEAIVTLPGDYPNFEAVVYIMMDGFEASGVLIDEEWILSAGHNFFDSEGGNTTPTSASDIKIRTGNDVNENYNEYSVETIFFHPTWLAQDNFDLGNDLCLLKLSTPITDITPVQIFTENSVQIGSQVWVSGFGGYGEQPGQNPDLISKKHAMQNVLDRKTDNVSTTINGTTYSGGHLAFDFDNPSGTVNSLGDSYLDDQERLLFGTEGTSSNSLLEFEGATVAGDSGGPIFIKDGNEWKVAGVLSGGVTDAIPNEITSGYGDISLYTRTLPMLPWMQSVIED